MSGRNKVAISILVGKFDLECITAIAGFAKLGENRELEDDTAVVSCAKLGNRNYAKCSESSSGGPRSKVGILKRPKVGRKTL